MLADPKHPSTEELMADPWFSKQILEWWQMEESAEEPLSAPACIKEMRQAYERAASAAGSEVGEPELFTPFDPGIAFPCPQCNGALLPQCACLSDACVSIRDEGVRDRRRARDAACAQPAQQPFNPQSQSSVTPGPRLRQQHPGLGKRRSDNALGKQSEDADEGKSHKTSRKDGIASRPPARASTRANAGINTRYAVRYVTTDAATVNASNGVG